MVAMVFFTGDQRTLDGVTATLIGVVLQFSKLRFASANLFSSVDLEMPGFSP